MIKSVLKIFKSALKAIYSQVCWCMPVNQTLGRWKEEGQDFKAILSYRVGSRPAWTK